tara:strand:+ start:2007 stop:2120 length:114 start_codon:yes stop_codon:yes gene_type:complete
MHPDDYLDVDEVYIDGVDYIIPDSIDLYEDEYDDDDL